MDGSLVDVHNAKEVESLVEAHFAENTELLEVTFDGEVKEGDAVKVKNSKGKFTVWWVNCVMKSDSTRGTLVSEDAESNLVDRGWDSRDAAAYWSS